MLGWLLARPWLLLLLGLIDVGLITLLRSWQIIQEGTIPEILKELGLAIAIVGFVTWSVERARVNLFTTELSKLVDEKLNQIKETTTDAIRQGPLPRPYYEQVSQTMFLSNFFKYEWIVKLKFEWCKDGAFDVPFKDEFVRLFIEQEYRIKNISGVRQWYTIDHYESRDWDDKIPNATSFDYVRARLDKKDEFAINTDKDTDPPWHLANEGIRFTQQVELPSDGVLKVWVASHKLMRVGQYESRIMGEPTESALFQITGPDDLSVDIEVPEILLGTLKGKVKVSSKSDGKGSTSSVWHVARPLPPSACIFINWKQVPKDNVSAEQNLTATTPQPRPLARPPGQNQF